MNNNNPQVFPHPASQAEGITLFDMIMLSILTANQDITFYELLDTAKGILQLRNIAIQNLDNHKSMNQIMKEIEDNEYFVAPLFSAYNEKHM